MPNKETFKILPIKDLLMRYVDESKVWIDPFARNSIFKQRCRWTNDLNPKYDCTHNMKALDFLQELDDTSVDGVLFDPPYTLRQVKECYENVGHDFTYSDSINAGNWTWEKEEVDRIVAPDGIVISFGYNSVGMGINNGFKIEEILLVCHGGAHNDTIVTVERNVQSQNSLF